jgi:uncharacterized phage protein (TIGR02218 family)
VKTITANDLANRFQEESMMPADVFTILCKNGLWLTATSGQNDIYFPSPSTIAYPPFLPPTYTDGLDALPDPFVYYATQNGRWERGVVKSKVSFNLSAGEMQLSVIADPSVVYPGTETTLMSIITSGIFDGASIAVGKMFFPLDTYGQFVANETGVERVFSGLMGPFDQSGRSKFTFRVMDYQYMLNQKTPPNIIQTNCRWSLYSRGCTVTAGVYANLCGVTSVVNALTGTRGALVIYSDPVDPFPDPPYYDQGVVGFETGQNALLAYAVQTQQSDGGLKLVVPTVFPVAVDDVFVLFPGCDKTPATCASKFSNLINFGGYPSVPAAETGI